MVGTVNMIDTREMSKQKSMNIITNGATEWSSSAFIRFDRLGDLAEVCVLIQFVDI